MTPSNVPFDNIADKKVVGDGKASNTRHSFILPKSVVPPADANNDAPNRPDDFLLFNHDNSRMYLDILVDISMMFIRVQSHPGQKNDPKKESEMETVNASACEFL